jgi:hypothetical protein
LREGGDQACRYHHPEYKKPFQKNHNAFFL